MTAGSLMFERLYFAVSGGREYADYAHVSRVMTEERLTIPGKMVVVQGECPTKSQGADGLVKRWCRANGVPCFGLEAPWITKGKAAGPIRNGWMLDFLPIYKLIAFPGDRGTNNAVEQAERREICVRDERDRDASLAEDPKGLSGEAVAARAEGIAR